MVRILVVVGCLLALVLPALGQDSDAEPLRQIDKLIEQLGDEDEDVRTAAAQALGEVGPRAAPAIPALVAALSDRDGNVRYCATLALSNIGPNSAESVVPALASALSDEDKDVRGIAAEALGEFGPKAAPAIPALATALSDKDHNVRTISAQALIDIGPEAASVPALVAALSDEEFTVCVRAAEALGMVGAPAVPALAAALSDESRAWWAREALGDMGARLKAQGSVLWWVVPRVYWKKLAALLLLLVGWFALASRLPRRRPTGKLKQAALIVLTAAVPSALTCGAIGYAVTREWTQGFLPDTVLTVLPFPVTAVLSMGFVCALAAVLVCFVEAT